MKKYWKIFAVALAWLSYGIWEYYVQQWAKTEAGPIIRVDIIILIPGLIALTGWMFFSIIKNNKKSENHEI